MTLYLASYRVGGIVAFLDRHEEKGTLILDNRKDPVCHDSPFWNKEALERNYLMYRWVGDSLGNINHHTGRPPVLVNPEVVLPKLVKLLQNNVSFILLCVCRDERCHNRLIARELVARVPGTKVTTMGRMVPYE